MRNEPGCMDLRQWMDLLDREGELHRIAAPVSWDREIGTISRKVLERKGPALLFENIRGYESTRGRRVFTGGIGTRERLALALGFPKDTSNREIVQHVMKKNGERIPPVRVATGPVKQNILKGDAIDLLEFPVPKWHYLEGGRYINTYACIVTKDPDTGVQNAGIYRGMVGRKNSIPSLLIKGGQHWGQHFAKYSDRKEKMPVACVIGWDPIMGFLAGSPLPAGICEFDVLGAYRGAPVPVVRCETVDLEVPAGAEIIIEGLIDPDPASYEIEGPFAEFTGYVSDLPTPRPTIEVTCITHRNDPILRGTQEGNMPNSYSENAVISSAQRAGIAWNILIAAGIPGVLDVYADPITCGINIYIKIRKQYQAQPKQIAAALWGAGAGQGRYKHVFVFEDDIDVTSYEQMDWAIAYRVNAGHGGIVISPGLLGHALDPSTPLEERDVEQLGAGIWNRVLIDATRNWSFKRRPEWNNERFPPTVAPAPEDEALVLERWKEYGFE
jgi:4-hydroxy-3-polyprenylbenzoate decarboxylase